MNTALFSLLGRLRCTQVDSVEAPLDPPQCRLTLQLISSSLVLFSFFIRFRMKPFYLEFNYNREQFYSTILVVPLDY